MFCKIIKITLINIIFILCVFILLENIIIWSKFYIPRICEVSENDRVENTLEYNKNKKSIIVAGCSFTYGSGILFNENISYKLQQKTKRKVYNRGIPAWGPNANLKDIQTTSFFNNHKIIEPEYYIYTFISDHLRRIYINYWDTDFSNEIYNFYKIRNNELILRNKINLLDYIQITQVMKRINRRIFDLTPDDKKFDRLKLYLYTMRSELIKRYPNIKMVILVYNTDLDTVYTHQIKPFKTERWKELEDDGFILLRFDTPEFEFLADNKYISEFDNVHPNGKAWDIIVPIIIKKLGL